MNETMRNSPCNPMSNNTRHLKGHSMGTTGFMVMANKHPELQEKIILANFLAPVAYMGDMKSPIRLIAPFVDSLEVRCNLGCGRECYQEKSTEIGRIIPASCLVECS